MGHSCEYVKEFILVLLFINYCIIFHMNNYKPTFAPSCITGATFLKIVSFHLFLRRGIAFAIAVSTLVKEIAF